MAHAPGEAEIGDDRAPHAPADQEARQGLQDGLAADALQQAVAAYRSEFRPSAQLDQPYVIAGVNVIAADTKSAAEEQLLAAKRGRAISLFGRGRSLTDQEADQILASPAGRHVEQMVTYSAVGTPAEVNAYIEAFAAHASADELMVAHQSPTTEDRLRSVELLADAVQPAAAT